MIGATLVLAQTIAVVANAEFRPTPVLLPNVHYTVAVDTALGGLVVRDLSVPPVTFVGGLRVEGAEPDARGPEPRGYSDSVRFDPDGRVWLAVADQPGRPPIQVEVQGASGAAAGRLVIAAREWPATRVFVVTLRPFDMHEEHWRETGHGVRDRLRVDDERGLAFLSDTSAAGLTVAIGFGRGGHGRMQSDAALLQVQRRIGGDVATERRSVGALTIFLEPERDAGGTVRADLVFGLGATEEEAARAAYAARAMSDPPGLPAPRLRLVTPEPVLATLATHAINAWRPTLSAGLVFASGAQPYARGPDGANAAELAFQLGLSRTVCSDYERFRRLADATGIQRLATGTRLGRRGPYQWVQEGDSAGTNKESALVLKGHACYRGTRDAEWLRAELPALTRAAAAAARNPDDRWSATALERLAELEDEAARLSDGAGGRGDSLRALAQRVRGARGEPRGAELWRSVVDDARRAVNTRYGRIGLGETGVLLDRVVHGLFGVDERLDAIVVAPGLDGAFDDFPWRLEGWRVWDDTLSLTYRPALREATIRLGAPRRRRLVLRFPWLTASSCVTARRGGATETLLLVALADGSSYVDVRGAFEPVEVRVRAQPCS